MQALTIRRLPLRLTCDPRHTITRFFWLGSQRARKIIDRVIGLSDEQTAELLSATEKDFGHLGDELNDIFLKHFEEAGRRVVMPEPLTAERKRLIGAYFTMEYSFASAALFNPSMTPSRNQHGVEPGSLKFIMSLRCVGEGHISSIMFRRGVVDAAGNVTIEPGGPYREPKRWVEKRLLSKPDSRAKLAAMGVREVVLDALFNRLENPFTMQDLRTILYRVQDVEGLWVYDEEHRSIDSLGTCDYNVEMIPDGGMNHIVLFPMCEAESRGMEDMRLIRFTHDDGSMAYFGTYTAFNGWQIRVQLVEIPRPDLACIRTLHGRCIRDKGLALFPRKVQGKYMMSGRLDGENLYILHSNNIRIWDDAVLVEEPRHTWEFVQIGNCGSPIETEAGWLLLTHGVGPMRRYCIGATLLDLNDPTKIIGRLDEPLLMPGPDERYGYVPNVVYSCGSLVHNGNLVIPYGISDAATGFATVPLDGLLGRLC
ncbi:MAG: glycoside hydrolase family 130 protein [Phycisphaerales bacterium]|jgi:predicted GH43/DUF377 family glycosyl hydrolase